VKLNARGRRIYDIPIMFTDGTSDTVLEMEGPNLPRWLIHEKRHYVLMALNIYTPTTAKLRGTNAELRKISPGGQLFDSSTDWSSPPRTPKK